MAKCHIVVQTPDAAPIRGAWVYQRQGTTFTVVRSGADGRLTALRAGGDASHPWDYTDPFTLEVPSQVHLYYSVGAKPIPNAVLSANGGVFLTRALALPN